MIIKITIDDVNRTIKVEEQTNLNELVNWMKEHLTDWEKYKLDVSAVYSTWPAIYPQCPTYPPIVTYGTSCAAKIGLDKTDFFVSSRLHEADEIGCVKN